MEIEQAFQEADCENHLCFLPPGQTVTFDISGQEMPYCFPEKQRSGLIEGVLEIAVHTSVCAMRCFVSVIFVSHVPRIHHSRKQELL